MYAIAAVKNSTSTGLQVKVVNSASAAPGTGTGAYSATNTTPQTVEITQSGLDYSNLTDSSTSASQVFYVAYWLLESGSHQNTASAVGGEIDFSFDNNLED